MTDYTVADVSYNQDGEIEQFLLFWENGEPDTRRATPENVLLFDPEDNLPFDGGLQDFFDGDSALLISDDPRVIVAQSGNEYAYLLSVAGNTIETTPSQAEDFLEGVYTSLTGGGTGDLQRLHREVVKTQVRRDIINPLQHTFPERDRISIVSNGWLVDSFYLVDWDANMYTPKTDDGDYKRENGEAVEKDTTYEFVRLNRSVSDEIENETVWINGDAYELTEREMLFLSKVTWLLNRRHYHPDELFWEYTDQWADMPAEKPNLDQFDI